MQLRQEKVNIILKALQVLMKVKDLTVKELEAIESLAADFDTELESWTLSNGEDYAPPP